MDAILKQILEGQQQISTRLERIETDLSEVKTDLSGVKTDLFGVKTDLSEVKAKVYGLETQLHETNQIARNIEHATTELAAQVDNLVITTAKLEGNAASKENVADLSAQFRVMNDRLFRQEVETEKLKAVK